MTRPLLLPLRTGPGDDETAADAPAAGPELGPPVSTAQLALLPGGQMSERDHLLATLAHAFRSARRNYLRLAERDGSLIHGLVRGQPPSVHAHREYANGRAWVPPGHDGGTLEGMGDIYHWLAGLPGVAFGNAWSAIAHKPFRASVAAVIALIVAAPVLIATGHRFAAIMTGVAAATLAALWVAAGYLLSRARRALARTTTTVITDEETSEL